MKKILIKIFGIDFLKKCKSYCKYVLYFPKLIFKKRINYNEEIVKKVTIFSQKNKNIFFGYYDINPIKENKLLVHCAKKEADTKKNSIDIGYYDMKTGKYTYLTKSDAWCWQQGSRLRWSIKKDFIIYNDICDNHYCTKYFNINNRTIEKIIPYPLYDIDSNENYGISINFSRLQRLRPGYGYDKIPDLTEKDYCPKDDGLFLIDLKNNKKKLLISLYELAKNMEDFQKYEHYINHVCFSPNGKKIMFFHIYKIPQSSKWQINLCIFNLVNNQINIIEKESIASHYAWINNNKLLMTTFNNENGKRDYRIYDLEKNNYKIVEYEELKKDGHPTYIRNETFISDTYPDKAYYQHIFKYNMEKNIYIKILDIFSDPRLFGEKRCDLHPRISGNRIILDTTYNKKKRSMIVLGLIGEQNGK